MLVTGGTSGLGFAMSQALAEAGARVALTGRTGARGRAFARTACVGSAIGAPSTSRYRNSSAASAWFCVLGATRPSTARWVRNCSTSRPPRSRGCRVPWNRTNRRTQPAYDASVRRL